MLACIFCNLVKYSIVRRPSNAADVGSSKRVCSGVMTGFQGIFCQMNVDECESSPCLHQSQCIDHINGYTCDCLPGYTGMWLLNFYTRSSYDWHYDIDFMVVPLSLYMHCTKITVVYDVVFIMECWLSFGGFWQTNLCYFYYLIR